MQHTFKILIHKEPEGQYTATVPTLPGCITYGESVEHAIEMVKEAISLYVEELTDRGEAISNDNETLEYSLNIAV